MERKARMETEALWMLYEDLLIKAGELSTHEKNEARAAGTRQHITEPAEEPGLLIAY